MAGLIKREDVETVRDRARIDEIVGEHVTLRPAGVGSLKGLCPFHDEKSPSFNVRPAVGRWHCFGCGEGGDVISFVQKISALSFAEAVEFLAARVGVQLRYEEGSAPRPGSDPNRRARLTEANRLAADFFREQLGSQQAAQAREFLTGRGFDRAAAEHFGIGFAPTGWDSLLKLLRSKGFTEAEIVASGLVSQGQRGVYDRFRGRLIWPIRDLTGETIGFGARKIFDDDQGPKYLNTPETVLYKKSQVLYGIDLAKRDIAKTKQVIVVEGYTDVMAMHLAGETTAVATCGTAFGTDHVRIIRRLMGDTDQAGGVQLRSGRQAVGGAVVFTFDGDEAGNKAALKTFAEDDRFNLQPYVASDPEGRDPCDLRSLGGAEAVRKLVSSKKPLYEFVIRKAIESYDLSSVDGRVAALRAAVPEVARIRDHALRPEYARALAGWLGMPESQVVAAVAQASDGGRRRVSLRDSVPAGPRPTAQRPGATQDPIVRLEQQLLEMVLQYPQLVPQDLFDSLPDDAFGVPSLRAVHEAIRAAGGLRAAYATSGVREWVAAVLDQSSDPVDAVVNELSVAAIAEDRESALGAYAEGLARRMAERNLTRQVAAVRSAMDREEDPQRQGELFAELIRLEDQRRALRD